MPRVREYLEHEFKLDAAVRPNRISDVDASGADHGAFLLLFVTLLIALGSEQIAKYGPLAKRRMQ